MTVPPQAITAAAAALRAAGWHGNPEGIAAKPAPSSLPSTARSCSTRAPGRMAGRSLTCCGRSAMLYRSERAAVARVFCLARVLGVWPGYVRVVGGWVLTYDPHLTRAEHEGSVRG